MDPSHCPRISLCGSSNRGNGCFSAAGGCSLGFNPPEIIDPMKKGRNLALSFLKSDVKEGTGAGFS